MKTQLILSATHFFKQVSKPVQSLIHRLLPEPYQRTYLMRALVLSLVLRLGLFLVLYMIDRSMWQHQHVVSEMFTETLQHWDARHYLHLADVWYRNTPDDKYFLVFFPLYPALIKLVNLLVLDLLDSALLISWVCSVIAAYYLQMILHQENFDEDIILRSILLFHCCPGAMYLVLPYTESLFMALVLYGFYASYQQGWFRAGIMGALASATRITGVLLLPAWLLSAWLQKSRKWSLFWLMIIPSGALVYLYFNWLVLGNPFEFMKLQSEHWNQQFIMPWEQLQYTFYRLATYGVGRYRFNMYETRLLCFILGPILLLAGTRRMPLSWQVYAWMSFFIFVCSREVISMPRYLYTLFPIFPVLAHWGRRPMVFQSMMMLGGITLAGWFALFISGSGAY